jgi:hypothetical protein
MCYNHHIRPRRHQWRRVPSHAAVSFVRAVLALTAVTDVQADITGSTVCVCVRHACRCISSELPAAASRMQQQHALLCDALCFGLPSTAGCAAGLTTESSDGWPSQWRLSQGRQGEMERKQLQLAGMAVENEFSCEHIPHAAVLTLYHGAAAVLSPSSDSTITHTCHCWRAWIPACP